VHVPHGNLSAAREVKIITEDAGLKTAAYGSYYRAGESEQQGLSFGSVLETACELGAPLIRVWAGTRASDAADDAYRAKVAVDARRIAGMAAAAGVAVAFEIHRNTPTDTNESARRLMEEVDHANVKTYWQRPVGSTFDYASEGLHTMLPWLTNLHVFHWADGQRRPLKEGEDDWRRLLPTVCRERNAERFALIEFVRNDEPDAFIADAQTLNEWIRNCTEGS